MIYLEKCGERGADRMGPWTVPVNTAEGNGLNYLICTDIGTLCYTEDIGGRYLVPNECLSAYANTHPKPKVEARRLPCPELSSISIRIRYPDGKTQDVVMERRFRDVLNGVFNYDEVEGRIAVQARARCGTA